VEIKCGIGWMPDPNRLDFLRAAETTDYVAEIERLQAAIRQIADMADDEWNQVKYHAMKDWARKVLADEQQPRPVTAEEDAKLRAACGEVVGLIGDRIVWRNDEQKQMWCESCGTVSNDGSCDCTKFGRAAKFVPYDEQSGNDVS
jgi:hypothetical protein